MTTSLIHGGSLTPLQEASAERLAPMRALLADAGFSERAVCSRAGAESIYDFDTIYEGRTTGLELNDKLDVLIRLFMVEPTVARWRRLRPKDPAPWSLLADWYAGFGRRAEAEAANRRFEELGGRS